MKNCLWNWFNWGWVIHIRVSKLTIIGSDNGLSPSWRQAIIWTNAVIFLIWPLGTNFSEILIKIHIFSFKKMHLKMLSVKCRHFCLCLNVSGAHIIHELIIQIPWSYTLTRISIWVIQSLRIMHIAVGTGTELWRNCTISKCKKSKLMFLYIKPFVSWGAALWVLKL